MDDFATQMVFEQSSRVQRNNVRNGNSYHQSSSASQMGKRSPPNSALVRASNQRPPQPQHKNQMRYSVDNLLEIDTSYYNNYQVKPKAYKGVSLLRALWMNPVHVPLMKENMCQTTSRCLSCNEKNKQTKKSRNNFQPAYFNLLTQYF